MLQKSQLFIFRYYINADWNKLGNSTSEITSIFGHMQALFRDCNDEKNTDKVKDFEKLYAENCQNLPRDGRLSIKVHIENAFLIKDTKLISWL